jgi:hypothetical protein
VADDSDDQADGEDDGAAAQFTGHNNDDEEENVSAVGEEEDGDYDGSKKKDSKKEAKRRLAAKALREPIEQQWTKEQLCAGRAHLPGDRPLMVIYSEQVCFHSFVGHACCSCDVNSIMLSSVVLMIDPPRLSVMYSI